MPFCTDCGAENASDAQFCEQCGASFLAGVVPPPPPPPTVARSGFCPWRLGALIAAIVLIAAAAAGVFAYRATSGHDDGDSTVAAEETATARAEKTAKPTQKPTARKTATKAPATKLPATETPPAPPTEAPAPTEQPLPPGYATPEEALADYVTNFLKGTYAGDCDFTNIETDVGKICSRLFENRGDNAVYAIGVTFSEFGEWVLLVKVEGRWQVAKTAPVEETLFEPPF